MAPINISKISRRVTFCNNPPLTQTIHRVNSPFSHNFMITIKSDIPYLRISFAKVQDIDIIQNLKERFDMMEIRFAGKPNKTQMLKAYNEYVKVSPADVLRSLRPKNLELMNGILKQGKGGHVTVKGILLYNHCRK